MTVVPYELGTTFLKINALIIISQIILCFIFPIRWTLIQPLISKAQKAIMTPEAHFTFSIKTSFSFLYLPYYPSATYIFLFFSYNLFSIPLYYFYLAYTNNTKGIASLLVVFWAKHSIALYAIKIINIVTWTIKLK